MLVHLGCYKLFPSYMTFSMISSDLSWLVLSWYAQELFHSKMMEGGGDQKTIQNSRKGGEVRPGYSELRGRRGLVLCIQKSGGGGGGGLSFDWSISLDAILILMGFSFHS